MRPLLCLALFPLLVVACGSTDGLDTKLSTELQRARFLVLLWPPDSGSSTPSATPPSHTKCALRLRDENTGTIYQLAQATKQEPADGRGNPADWPELGDYSVHRRESDGSGGSHRVRIDCGTWKPLGIVAARPRD